VKPDTGIAVKGRFLRPVWSTNLAAVPGTLDQVQACDVKVAPGSQALPAGIVCLLIGPLFFLPGEPGVLRGFLGLPVGTPFLVLGVPCPDVRLDGEKQGNAGARK
jgi:hypothetical protein